MNQDFHRSKVKSFYTSKYRQKLVHDNFRSFSYGLRCTPINDIPQFSTTYCMALFTAHSLSELHRLDKNKFSLDQYKKVQTYETVQKVKRSNRKQSKIRQESKIQHTIPQTPRFLSISSKVSDFVENIPANPVQTSNIKSSSVKNSIQNSDRKKNIFETPGKHAGGGFNSNLKDPPKDYFKVAKSFTQLSYDAQEQFMGSNFQSNTSNSLQFEHQILRRNFEWELQQAKNHQNSKLQVSVNNLKNNLIETADKTSADRSNNQRVKGTFDSRIYTQLFEQDFEKQVPYRHSMSQFGSPFSLEYEI